MGQAEASLAPRVPVRGGKSGMHQLLAALVFLLLCPPSAVSAEPYQCSELKTIISTCVCEARVFRNVEISNQVVINCRNMNLSSVPTITGQSNHVIYEMTLAQNNIQTLTAAAFNGLRIQRLDLRKNRLTMISNSSFEGLESDLKELYLGAEKSANVPPPLASLTRLTRLNTLHLAHFTFPQNALEPGVLNLLTSLTSLTLESNGVTFIEALSLPSSLTSLTLDRQKLSSFPVDALRKLSLLESLVITKTNIPALYRQALEKNTRLTHLDLSHNQINTLSDGCFEGITTSLLSLSLSNNPLTNATSLNEIKELVALATLQLSYVSLKSLPPGASFLLGKESLTALHLEGNVLTTLGPSVFTNLPSLQELSLASNQLTGMDDQVFAGLSSLVFLDMGQQAVAPVPGLTLPESLTSLTSLQTLRLSRNPLTTPTLWTRLSPMGSLKTLRLDGTSLTTVPDHALRNLTQLEELDLDNNDLTEVTQEMLAGPRLLQKLTLNKNRITTVSHCALYNFTLPPLYVELVGNPLLCDCKLRWLLEHRDAGRVTLSGAETCASPADKAGVYLLRLLPTALTCVPDQLDQPCPDPYSTPAPPVTSTLILGLTVTNVSSTTISVTWSVSNIPAISHFKVWNTNLQTSQSQYSAEIPAADTAYQARGLQANTPYSVCIFAYLASSTTQVQTCEQTKTLSDGSSEESSAGDEDSSSEVGIIVGTVVAVLVLLAVLAAILFLVCRRRQESKALPALPPQPHLFTSSELPTMTPNSRNFTKPPPKVGRALDESMQVTVISDGHTGPASPRHSVGSYQFLDGSHPNPNPQVGPTFSTYSNDVDSRPLPSAPNMSLKGHHNGALHSPPHTYSEADHK